MSITQTSPLQAFLPADLARHGLIHLLGERLRRLTGAYGLAVARQLNSLAGHDPVESVWQQGPPCGTDPLAACSTRLRVLQPLRHGEQMTGTLELLDPQAHAFAEEELEEFTQLGRLLARVLPQPLRQGLPQPPHLGQFSGGDRGEQFRRVFHQSSRGLAILTPDERVLEGNAALGVLFNCPVEALRGASVLALIRDEDTLPYRREMARLLTRELWAFQCDHRLRGWVGRSPAVTVTYSRLTDSTHPPFVLAQFQEAPPGTDMNCARFWQRGATRTSGSPIR